MKLINMTKSSVRDLSELANSSLVQPAGSCVGREHNADLWDDECVYGFISLMVSPAVDEWQETSVQLLSFST